MYTRVADCHTSQAVAQLVAALMVLVAWFLFSTIGNRLHHSIFTLGGELFVLLWFISPGGRGCMTITKCCISVPPKNVSYNHFVD